MKAKKYIFSAWMVQTVELPRYRSKTRQNMTDDQQGQHKALQHIRQTQIKCENKGHRKKNLPSHKDRDSERH